MPLPPVDRWRAGCPTTRAVGTRVILPIRKGRLASREVSRSLRRSGRLKGRALIAATAVVALTTVVAGAANAGTVVGAPGIQVSTPSPATFTSYGGIRLR